VDRGRKTFGRRRMEPFLAACQHRAADGALHHAIQGSTRSLLPAGQPLWRIEWREGRGRVLVASQDLERGTLVFCERPLVVAPVVDTGDAANRGEAQAVASALLAMPAEATALLCSPAHGADTAEAASLAKAADAFAAACPTRDARRARHCLGVASVNVHSAARPTRGVLGVLSSMMEHCCSPSAMVTVGAEEGMEEGGSLLSLRTLRRVPAGEALSISYVVAYQPTATRQQQLRQQHGFTCGCARCEDEPELVRCFVCPSCGEGPASPLHSVRRRAAQPTH
jgi:hypothetical protein